MYKFLRYPGFKRKAVTLSYDDGVIYDKKLIEILDKYGLKCTFNLNSGLYETGEKLKKDEATIVYSNPNFEVACHGACHLSLDEVSNEIALNDVMTDRINLEKQFGRMIKGFAYANGSYSNRVIQILKDCGIKYARTTEKTFKFDLPTDFLKWPITCHHKDDNLMELVDAFLKDEESKSYYWLNNPLLFYLFGHSYEFKNDNNWEVIEEFARKIGNRKDIWYATNMQIYDYVNAYLKLEYSMDGNIIYNPTSTDLYLCYHNKNILIKAGSIYQAK